MALVPYEPLRHLENMRREFDRVFSGDFSGLRSGLSQHFGNLNVDVHETDDEVVVTCDIPGLEKKEDVSLDIERNTLSISGTIKRESGVEEEHMHRKERFVGRFHRMINLPSPVASEEVSASYKNGVLQIRMSKLQGDTKKKIDVQFH